MNQIKINYEYEIILKLLKKDSHGRELSKELNTSLTRIQNILNELRNNNIIDYKIQGKNHIYFIKKNLISKLFIFNAENYKLIQILRKELFLEPIFKEILEKYPNELIVLFGSYAKFINKKDSDIDIYINTNDKQIKKEIENIFPKISVKFTDFDKENLLIREIIKNHVIIQGAEIFYEKLKFFKEN
ncbi:MAG: nucleotidyltransferase domain-containing protein [Candidatus Woesearchaeota archaeon]